ncbi:MAG TPA: trypsin-like peptidase domain-containing protein [Longimicrobiales bacterium]
MRPSVRQIAAGTALVAVTVAGATGLEAVRESAAATRAVQQAAPGRVALSDPTPASLSRAFRRAAERALPSVVHVRVESVRQARIEVPEPFRGTPWEDLFDRGEGEPIPRQGSGSGFIFREDGYILTNNHVVDGAERITVVLQDRREFDAELVGRDPNTDVAVLKIDAKGLPTIALGDSDPVAVGDWVVALGYPLRLGATATAGIISAKGRQIGIIGRNDGASAPLEHFIQTDAAINPGNSGGPLVNLDGEVIGINTAIASPTGFYSGYGFAVPIDIAQRVATDLIEHGVVRRPKLGVAISDVTPADAEVYGLDHPTGAEVVQIQAGSAAERAGLRLGDVIVAVDGTPVESTGDLMELLARHDPGETAELSVVRYGDRIRLRAELGAFESAVKTARKTADEHEAGVGRLGFDAQELTSGLARRLGIDADAGVVIVRVAAASPAAQAGLAPGMVIERLNGRDVSDIDDLEAAAQAVGPGAVVSLVVRTRKGDRTIVNYRVRE